MSRTGLAFHYKIPPRFNLGDYLCSPRHYFDFKLPDSEKSVVIIGGGAFNDLASSFVVQSSYDIHVLWGIGRSFAPDEYPQKMNEVADFGGHICHVSTRDRDYGGRSYFVPCVSVCNPIVETPLGNRTGLFLNADHYASGHGVSDLLAENADLVTGTNSMTEREFVDKFAQTDKLFTNSYHAAYWSLLSGRAVSLIGYSSKFTNLLRIFDLSDDLIMYQRGNAAGLRASLERARIEDRFIKLDNPFEYVRRFRHLNLEFAHQLISLNVFATVTHRSQNEQELHRREMEIDSLLNGGG